MAEAAKQFKDTGLVRGSGMTSPLAHSRLVDEIKSMGIADQRVLDAVATVPRHEFMDSAISHRAYENVALPIGWEQTISQPYTVARITEVLLAAMEYMKIKPTKILEIGTGCGYQAAILAQLFDEVYGVERIEALHEVGRQNLARLGIDNVKTMCGDGREGWVQHAPYDAVVISAATAELPPAIWKQMATTSCAVLPQGGKDNQQITLVTKNGLQRDTARFDNVIFVPLLDGVAQTGGSN